ncbi:hypothetical protein [Pontibacter sp. SGAir0037]|uniref:hypothetical protein n=1 Tax=Pontibacter sp. SGAir0037 TaxID=2571030 RepID=UPI0010CCEA5E|nr:hypothetical protein [Pontibacter sp. SGAir0037]QCR24756.1 hypothetical protein C1N53_21960 [Pontibacter sp. SGAir0037]
MKKEVQIPEEKIVMSRDQDKIEEFKRRVESLVDQVNKVITSFRRLGLGELSMQDISKLTTGKVVIANIVRDRIVDGKPVEVAGLSLDIEQVKQMVKLPDLSDVESAINMLKGRIKRDHTVYYRTAHLSDVAIVDDEAVLSEDVLSSYIDSVSVYAVTDREKEIYLKVECAKDLIQELHDQYGVSVIHNDTSHNILRQIRSDGGYKAVIEVSPLKRRMDEIEGRNRY